MITLSKIIALKKIKLLPSFFLIFIGLFFVAKPAFALFGIGDIGLLDLAMMQMDALDFIETTVIKYFFTLVGLLVGSQIFVVISATLLQWAINLPINLDNALVQAGWNFMGGLANLFFILVFLGIAFAYIFKVETWGMKKALPPLIIVALLINFSLLFVQMFTDIAQIAWNSLLSPFGTNFVKMAIQPLLSNLGVFVGMIFGAITAYGFAALIPYGNVIASVGIMTWFLTDTVLGATGGIFLKSIFIVILNLTLGSIFLAYFFLFMARVVIFWLLAIFSPLALFAYILPNTRKYFNQWLSALFEWGFLGIIAFFLLGLGMNLFSLVGSKGLLQWGGDINTGKGILPGFSFNYIFLIIYLLVVWKVSKKFAPKGTEMAWQAGKLAMNRGITPLAKLGAKKFGASMEMKQLGTRQGFVREIQRREAAGERLSWGQRIAKETFVRQPEQALKQTEARLMALKGRQVQEEQNNIMNKIKGMDEETAKSTLIAEAARIKPSDRNKNKIQALVEELARRGASVDPELYKEAARNAGPIPEKPEDFAQNRIQRIVLPRMLHLARDEAEMEAVIKKMNPADMDKLDGAAKVHGRVIKQIVASMRPDLIGRLSAQNEIVNEKVQKEMERQFSAKWKTPGGMNEKELRMLRGLHKSSSLGNVDLDLEKLFGSLQEVEDRLKNFGRPPKPPKPPEEGPPKPPKLYSTSGKPLI